MIVLVLASSSWCASVTTDQDQRDAILEAQVEAALGGHDIGPFEEVENGYQAACRRRCAVQRRSRITTKTRVIFTGAKQ